MKTLTDNIIESIQERADESFDPVQKKAYVNVIISIKRIEKTAQFEDIARLMMKYLADHHHPHVTVIITSTNAQLMEGIKSTGEIMDYIKD